MTPPILHSVICLVKLVISHRFYAVRLCLIVGWHLTIWVFLIVLIQLVAAPFVACMLMVTSPVTMAVTRAFKLPPSIIVTTMISVFIFITPITIMITVSFPVPHLVLFLCPITIFITVPLSSRFTITSTFM
jgi:hypothetical protein